MTGIEQQQQALGLDLAQLFQQHPLADACPRDDPAPAQLRVVRGHVVVVVRAVNPVTAVKDRQRVLGLYLTRQAVQLVHDALLDRRGIVQQCYVLIAITA